ncbi:MAG: right-handed parallel beta-helix repeat-containing protein [bacterium]
MRNCSCFLAAALVGMTGVEAARGQPTPAGAWQATADTFSKLSNSVSRTSIDAGVALFEHPAAPAQLRSQAVAFLVQASRKGAELPSRVLVKLPDCLELDTEEQRLFGLALAAAYAREKKFDAAIGVFKQLLALSDGSPLEAAELRQRFAQTLRQAGRFGDAREQYAALMTDPRLPAYTQGLAALAIGQAWQQEHQLTEAVTAYQAAANRMLQLPHLKSEAEACAAECARLIAGKPAHDPEANRQRLRPLPAPAISYFVSPKGSDTNPGTLAKPFATLERARDAVRTHKTNGALPPGGVAVCLRGGTYTVTNTFLLGEADSGSFGAPVVYRAWQQEKPVFDGGFRVRTWKRVSDPAILVRLPPEARGNVRVADLKAQGFTGFAAQQSYGYGINNQTVRELYQDGRPLQVARWPNDGSMKIGEVLDATNLVFACKTDRLARWTGATDLLANGYWVHLWAGCTVPVAAVDPAAGTIRLKEKPGYGITRARPFYVLNLLEEIDQPGEWYLDRASGRLYVWPMTHPWFSELVLSRWDKPFIAASKVQEIVFQGLTFEYGQQNGLVLDACVNTTVAGCVLRRLGGTALTALQGANLRIYGNLLQTLGHTGMRVGGGNRKNLTSGQIVIENNDVENFGRCSRTYNPAVLLEGCGARVAHNHFHHAPSSAMRIEGNDHLIEFNQVDHVVQESDDQGGIDMWGNPSYRGVVIRHNRWQDIGGGAAPCGQAGIRLDDAISGIVVYGNFFERTSNGNFGGVQIHGGQKNIIDNNVFVGCRYGVSFSPWAQARWVGYLNSDPIQKLIFTEVNIRLPPYSTRYPELTELGRQANINSIWRNVFVGSEQALFKAPSGTDAGNNQVFAEMPDLNAVAAQSAFRPLPLDEIGLYDDPVRAKE